MNLRNGTVLVAKLTTVGRKTGLPRAVELRLVYLDGKFYATSSNVQTKHWCRNMIQTPAAEVSVRGEKFPCAVRRITEDDLRRRILTMRDSPPLLERAVFEMTPK